ncbi:MAG: hypothetical protein ACRD2W_17865 [Acidimicrobiales bacterium]
MAKPVSRVRNSPSTGPSTTARPAVHETVYEDEIVDRRPRQTEVVEEDVVDDVPATRTRRRVIGY